jgi:iron(II)-dependent oxidoreductase
VWEWTQSLWGKNWEKPDFRYPYRPEDGRENLEAGREVLRVWRGGAFFGSLGYVRCAARYGDYPYDRLNRIGFRVVLAPGF